MSNVEYRVTSVLCGCGKEHPGLEEFYACKDGWANPRPADDRVRVVADAIIRSMFAPHELPLDGELQRKYEMTARAAIAATKAEIAPRRSNVPPTRLTGG